MRKFLFGAVSAVALLAAGSAFAQDTSNVTQSGTGGIATVDQTLATGTTNSTITQESANQNASVTQGGQNNTSLVDQNTDLGYTNSFSASTAYVDQVGSGGNSDVGQYGHNYAGVIQDSASHGETAYIRQTGYNPGSWGAGGATIYQNGQNDSGWALQTGEYNSSTVIQTGAGGGPYATGVYEPVNYGTLNAGTFGNRQGGGSQQIGNSNVSFIDQAGTNGFADNDATGNSNNQYIYQGAGTTQATAFINTFGDGNSNTITQLGGGAYSGNSQYGGSNNITVTQNGNSKSLIGQGTHIDGYGIGSNDGPQAFGANATVSQSGNSQFSQILQFDGATATVTQIQGLAGTGANTSTVEQDQGAVGSNATVYQAGSGGSSSVLETGATGGYDTANVTQTSNSTGAWSSVIQTAYNDYAVVNQSGASDISTVTQNGASDWASVSQSGGSDTSTVAQTGASDFATVTQASGGANSTVTQPGSGNTATVHQ